MGLEGKRVLLATSHKRIGSGGSMQLFLLARSLVQAGAAVHAAIAGRAGDDLASRNLDRLAALGVAVHFFMPSRWYNPVEIARFRRFLKSHRFDIVHTHKGGDLSLALLASPGLQIPAFLNTRGVNFPLGLNRLKYNWKRLDRIIVVSEDSKNVMVRRGVREEKIRVIYGGVDTRRFHPRPESRDAVRDALQIPRHAKVLLMAANLVRQKGHSDYLFAVAKLAGDFPDAVHLFAGDGDASALERQARDLGISDCVRFLGFRDDVEDLFAASDISVVASFAGEGVSGVLRESMACGVPVITTNVGGNAELVRHEETGLVVPVHSPQDMAEAIRRLLSNPSLYKKLSDAGRVYVMDNFSDEQRARRIFALYEEIFREKGLEF